MKKYPSWEVLLPIQNVLCLLEGSVEAYPHRMTFADEHTSLTYHQLSDLSMRIDSVLGQKTGPCRPVPVLAERNVSALTTFMGIVRTGCSYVFLDTSQPTERLNWILDTLQADLMITDKESLSLTGPVSSSGEVFPPEDLMSLPDSALNPGPLASICRQSTDTDLLHGILIFSSIGVPKGVVASHRPVIDFIEHFTDLFYITQNDIIGSQTPFDFNASTKDIYSAPKTGAILEVIPKRLFSIPTGLLDYLRDKKIIMAIWVISALCIITTPKGFTYRASPHLNKTLFSGEVMPIKHLNTQRSCPPKALFMNLYGPMEITCNCTYYMAGWEFESGTPVPIGRPFPNETVFPLGENNRLITEPGQNGELCVVGIVLVLGHYRDLRRTTVAFAQNPLNSCHPEIIYRTGDLARCGRDGLLYFNGRKDFQIKHMEHRIELGEIEVALETAEGMGRAVCLFLEEKSKIAVFYEDTAAKRDTIIGLGSLSSYYTFSSLYRNLTESPHTGNGRVDRQVLRKPYG